ncbi:MAG: monoheme cytochrome C [Maribacter sp.]
MSPTDSQFRREVRKLYQYISLIALGIILVMAGALYLALNPGKNFFDEPNETEEIQLPEENIDQIVDGIHVSTGFKEGKGLIEVIQNCTNCHSAALVTQNKMTREGWLATIRWMQETQNLWDLGKNEETILNYLSSNYAPDKKGRRDNLEKIDWYNLENP